MYVLLHLAVRSSRARCLHSPAGPRRNSSSADTRLAFLLLFDSLTLSCSAFCTYTLNSVLPISQRLPQQRYVSFLMKAVLKLINNFFKKKKKACLKNSSKNQLTDYARVFAKAHRVQQGGINFLLKLRPTSATSYTTTNMKMRNFTKSSVPANTCL